MCTDGYVLKYDAESTNEWKTNADECVPNTIEGCHVGVTKGVCYRCKAGYFLNESHNCDLVLSNDVCLVQGTFKKNKGTAYSYLNDDPFKLGCVKCKNTMHSVSFSF